jgi:hypothetical protein
MHIDRRLKSRHHGLLPPTAPERALRGATIAISLWLGFFIVLWALMTYVHPH